MHGSRSLAQKNRMKSCVCVTRFCSLGIFTGIFTRSVRTRRMLWGFFQRRLRNWIEIQWKVENEQLQVENERLQGEKERLQAEMEQLQDQITQRQEELDSMRK